MRSVRDVAPFAVLLGVAMLATAARAQTQGFTASYTGQGAFASSCNSTMDIVGEEPTIGTHPVFLWMVGTFELDIDDAPAHRIVAGMAARGFVAASVEYDTSFFGTCGQIGGKAECIFDANSAASAVSVLCGRARADCRKGIVVGGLSQGSILVDLAKNYDPRVRAGWGIGDGTNYAFFDISACVEPANRALPIDRLRVVNGESDLYLSGDDHSRTQSAAVTGYDCGPTAWNCLQPDGSGYYIVQSSQVEDGDADHCYHGDGGCIASQTSLDAGWESGGDPWQLNASLDWLASFAGFCGDGEVQSTPPFGEQCDVGATNGAPGSCCTASCTLAAASTVCRPAADDCDLAESCTGTSTVCPGDAKRASGTGCTTDANPCTLDECNGTSDGCQHPAGNPGAMCRAPAGICDVAETCTGTTASCPPDAFQSGTAVCRPSAGVCDVAENCTGTSVLCPANALASTGTVCRPAAGACDVAESCTATSATCPADGFRSSTTPCRTSAGICDVAESCSGSSAACPADGFASSATVCRAAAGVCDPAETCTGSAAACPVDVKSTAVCRAAAGTCDVAEVCDGVANGCPPNAFAPSTQQCRAANGVCDVAETCTGSSAVCPPDALATSTTVCRPATSDCDAAESCTGSTIGCPAETSQPDGTACDDGVTCTIDDRCVGGTCSGDSMTCGDGVVQTSCGEVCDDGNMTSGDGCSATCQPEFVCEPAPKAGCKRSIATGASQIQLKDKTPDRGDAVGWKWSKGAMTTFAELGAPLTTTDYLLCIHDGRGLVSGAFVPAGGSGGGKSWSASLTGFKYKDKDATADGVTSITLRFGVAGQAKIILKGRGVRLQMPSLPMSPPVTVQLRNSDGSCWEAVYGAPPLKNASTQYRDKSD